MIKTINGTMYLNMLRGGAESLNANRTAVNDLNVFPIPDGDTGDNMYMTIEAGASKTADSPLLGEVATHAAHEMLLGARGNSGVILSRIFAGIGKGLESVREADTVRFVHALRQGVKEAYRAVSNPVEGTILTVYREAVEAVSRCEPESFEKLFDEMLRELAASLERTPELLDVLKEADVVDSGGAGFVYIAEGMKAALAGLEFGTDAAVTAPKSVNLDAFTEDSELEFGYCTEFLLRLQHCKIDIDSFDLNAFIGWLNSVGDSVVAFREGTIVKVHVHTKRPGDILNHCQQYGEFLTTKIENMTLQHNEAHGKVDIKLKNTKPKKPYGIVTVASGEGLREIFTSLGVDAVVDGGQSMNPSAKEMLQAYEDTGAQTVYVFPNNKNIILTAEQAAAMAQDIDVRIIRTKTVGEGYAAVSMFDVTVGDTDAVVDYLNEVISGVVTGIVSVASRDVEGAVSVVKGDYIGFVGDTIYVDEKTPEEAMRGLCEKVDAKNYDVMLILAGADVKADASAKMYEQLKQEYRRTEIIMLDGGQPIYDYIMILN